jgi:para-nitrobenzyl esterase
VAARSFIQRSREVGITAPIYYSVFDPEIPGWDNPGTFHSVDLWFWFETLAKCWRPFVGKHYDLARQMCNYMTNFIRSGDPNGNDADGTLMPEWKPMSPEAPHAMRWGDVAEAVEKQPEALIDIQIKAWLEKFPSK